MANPEMFVEMPHECLNPWKVSGFDVAKLKNKGPFEEFEDLMTGRGFAVLDLTFDGGPNHLSPSNSLMGPGPEARDMFVDLDHKRNGLLVVGWTSEVHV